MLSFSKVWTPFFFLTVSEQGPCFTAVEEDGDDRKLVELELACEADAVSPPDPVRSGHLLPLLRQS